jgi:hypothetical protein
MALNMDDLMPIPEELARIEIPLDVEAVIDEPFLEYGKKRGWLSDKEAARRRALTTTSESHSGGDPERSWAILILWQLLRQWDRLERPDDIIRGVPNMFSSDVVPEISHLSMYARSKKIRKVVAVLVEDWVTSISSRGSS